MRIEALAADDVRVQELGRGAGEDYDAWLQYWSELRRDERDPLSHPAWFSAHLAHADLGIDPRVLMVRDGDGRLCTVVPVQLRGRDVGVALAHARGFDCKSIALRRDELPAFCGALFGRRVAGLGRIRSLKLNEVDETNAILDVEWPGLTTSRWHRSVIDVSEGYDAMMGRLSSKTRNNVRRVRRKLEQRFEVAVETIEAGARIDEAFDRYLCVDDRSWKGDDARGSTLREDGPQREALRHGVRRMSLAGRAVVHILTADGHDVAAQLCCRIDDQLHLVKTSYDQTLASLAPGKVLLDAALRDYCPEHGLRAVNMVTGLRWHLQWRPTLLKTRSHWLFAHGALGAWAQTVDVPPRTRAVALLRRSGLEEPAKRLRARLVG